MLYKLKALKSQEWRLVEEAGLPSTEELQTEVIPPGAISSHGWQCSLLLLQPAGQKRNLPLPPSSAVVSSFTEMRLFSMLRPYEEGLALIIAQKKGGKRRGCRLEDPVSSH